MTVTIALAESAVDLRACLAIRRRVFIEEQGVSEAEEVDGLDDRCSHVLAKADGRAVGAARFRRVDDAVKLQRVCVAPELRGTGVGARLIEFMIAAARAEPGVACVLLSAQTDALNFYRKLGFEAQGDVYMDAGIPHRDMTLPLCADAG